MASAVSIACSAPTVVLQRKKDELPGLGGLPSLKLLAAEFRNPLPAKGMAVDDDGVRLGHDPSRGVRLGGGILQAVQKIRRPLGMGRCCKDRALVVLQDLNPRRDVGG